MRAGVLNHSPFNFAVSVSLILMLPMLFLPSFKKLSALNLLGCISTLLVSATILYLVLADIDRTRMPIQVLLRHNRFPFICCVQLLSPQLSLSRQQDAVDVSGLCEEDTSLTAISEKSKKQV